MSHGQATLTERRLFRDHLAIMKKSWGLLPKILSGEKTVETRWAKNRHPYWASVNGGDSVYFKDSGEPVTVKATVDQVARIELMGPDHVLKVLQEYSAIDGIEAAKIPQFASLFAAKRYCMVVYLRNPERIKPFDIDKTGYGNQVAWITVDSIESLKATAPSKEPEGAVGMEQKRPSVRLYYEDEKFMVKAYKNGSAIPDAALRKMTLSMLRRALRRVEAYPGEKGFQP